MRDLILLTDSFPFGTSETFLESEVDYLSESFNNIYVLPDFESSKNVRNMPDNFRLLSYKNMQKQELDKSSDLRLRFILLRFIFMELMIVPKSLFWNIGNLTFLKQLIRKESYKANLIKGWINQTGNKVNLYSYWFGDNALRAGIISHQTKDTKWISRVHGYDLYDERHPAGLQLFRNLKVNFVYKLFCVSKKSKEYLDKRIAKVNRAKITVGYLGLKEPDFQVQPGTEPFKIVSCANLIDLKRVNLNIDLASKLTFEVEWTHFGDGELLSKLKKQAEILPLNVKFRFARRLTNKELIQCYKRINPNLFVHLSESEGLPVSIMEILCLGVPVMACDVGGISEQVNDQTGILINKDFDMEFAVECIKRIENQTLKFNNDLISQFGRKHFTMKENINVLLDQLK